MFRPPRELFRDLKKDVPVFVIVFVAGLAWTITLGTQSFAEGLGVWKYFPVEGSPRSSATVHAPFWAGLLIGGDETDFNKSTAKVDDFQVDANEDQKQQYERFVVIKEACGNLFISGLLSLPAWLVMFLNGVKPKIAGRFSRFRFAAAPSVACIYFVVIMVGLHRMNAQHVKRQLKYTEIIMENRAKRPQKPTPAPSQK